MIRFFEVLDEGFLEDIFRFRYDVVVDELGFFDPNEYEGKKERDEWDEYATHFVALDSDCNIVATTRIIHHCPFDYPTERYMQIDPAIKSLLDLKRDALCEISRLFIAKDYRNMHDTKIIIDGFVVGAITGMVGVGGGFLIIPALVLLGGLPMRLAVGTSLVIIALKSFAGFWEYLHVLDSLHLAVDWTVIWLIAAIGIAGGWLGHHISHRMDQATLRRVFAVFLVFMGAFIIYKNWPF